MLNKSILFIPLMLVNLGCDKYSFREKILPSKSEHRSEHKSGHGNNHGEHAAESNEVSEEEKGHGEHKDGGHGENKHESSGHEGSGHEGSGHEGGGHEGGGHEGSGHEGGEAGMGCHDKSPQWVIYDDSRKKFMFCKKGKWVTIPQGGRVVNRAESSSHSLDKQKNERKESVPKSDGLVCLPSKQFKQSFLCSHPTKAQEKPQSINQPH